MHRIVAPLALATLTFACAGDIDPEATPSGYASSLSMGDAQALIDVVNYPGTTVSVLDIGAHFDSRAANNIVSHRSGPDGISPSADDHPFTTITEIDDVPYVGDAAFRALYTYVAAHPAPQGTTVEGIAFQGWQQEAVVWGVNHATQTELNAILDTRAATGLVAIRPFSSVTAMGPVAYVGSSALTALRNAASGWWSAMHSTAPALAGTFDSVTFDEATATTALAIANQASAAQFTSHGVTTSAANAILGARPYTTLAAVSAVSGVGTATMNALKTYAASGTWGVTTCTNAFAATATSLAPHLLFLSESDRPIEIVSYPGQGATAPTAASVLALVTEEAGMTVEQRDVSNYYVAFEPNDAMGDAAVTQMQAAVQADLTDLIYVAVSLPQTDDYHSEVRVYLLGRDGCGNLVGLKSIAVET